MLTKEPPVGSSLVPKSIIVSIEGLDGAVAEEATLSPLSVHVLSDTVEGLKSILLARRT